MDFSLFRNDLLTKGAILGCVMLASCCAETWMFYKGGAEWLMPIGLEILSSMVLYVFLMYRFTKSYSKLVLEARAQAPYFTYGEGLIYAMNVSGLAGIVVGVGSYLFMHYVVGYQEYIDAYIKTFQDMLSQVPMQPNEAAIVREAFDELQKSSEPSLLSGILSYVTRYIMTGAFVGLIIAAITKRNLWNNISNSNSNVNEPKDEQ